MFSLKRSQPRPTALIDFSEMATGFAFDSLLAGLSAVGCIYSVWSARKVEAKWREKFQGICHSPSPNARILWGVVCLTAVGIPANLFRPRGPIVGPWQFLITLTLVAPAITAWIGLTFLRTLTNAVYTSSNLKSKPPKKFRALFDTATYFIAGSTLASIAASIATDDRRFEAICYGSLLIAIIFMYPYTFIMLLKLHRIVTLHLTTFRNLGSPRVQSTPLTSRPNEAAINMKCKLHATDVEIKLPNSRTYESISETEKRNDISGVMKSARWKTVSENVCGVERNQSGKTTSAPRSKYSTPQSSNIIKPSNRHSVTAARRRDGEISTFEILLKKIYLLLLWISLFFLFAFGLLLFVVKNRVQSSETISGDFFDELRRDKAIDYFDIVLNGSVAAFSIWYAQAR
mmetsp:Transcript_32751/g.53033  ORF Transcript_32751/g.53033 Transcript_32751/m.53033 type:complete len:402 (-) Transcript_32751:87-1292(-)